MTVITQSQMNNINIITHKHTEHRQALIEITNSYRAMATMTQGHSQGRGWEGVVPNEGGGCAGVPIPTASREYGEIKKNNLGGRGDDSRTEGY